MLLHLAESKHGSQVPWQIKCANNVGVKHKRKHKYCSTVSSVGKFQIPRCKNDIQDLCAGVVLSRSPNRVWCISLTCWTACAPAHLMPNYKSL